MPRRSLPIATGLPHASGHLPTARPLLRYPSRCGADFNLRRATSYLADYCVSVSTVPGRQHLQSASRRQLIVPRVNRSTFGARAFAIAGPTPTVWNSLPDSWRDPAVGPDQFRRDLKTHLFE